MGHRFVHALHLPASTRDRVVAAIRARLADDGFLPVGEAATAVPGEVRIVVRGSKAPRDGVLVALRSVPVRADDDAGAWLGAEWAAHLSRRLDATAIALGLPEDGYGARLTRFEGGVETAAFAIDEGEAATGKRGRCDPGP